MRNINYIKEINSFRKYAFDNYVSSNAVLLWYGLFGLNNDLRWQEWFKVDNLRLMSYSFIKREATLISARKELIDLGLIEFKKGSKGHPSEYRIVMFAEKQERVYPNIETKAEATESKNKVEKTEANIQQNDNEMQPSVSNDNSTVAVDERPKVNYFYYYKPKKATNNYKQYNPRDRSKSTNKFNNFKQRNIDINALECALLGIN